MFFKKPFELFFLCNFATDKACQNIIVDKIICYEETIIISYVGWGGVFFEAFGGGRIPMCIIIRR